MLARSDGATGATTGTGWTGPAAVLLVPRARERVRVRARPRCVGMEHVTLGGLDGEELPPLIPPGWGTELGSASNYTSIPPSAAAAAQWAEPQQAAASSSPVQAGAGAHAEPPSSQPSPRGAAAQTGELELLPKANIQKLISYHLPVLTGSQMKVSAGALDAIQKVQTPLTSYPPRLLPCC